MTDDQLAAEQGAFMQEQRSKREAAYEEGFDDGTKEAYADGRADERAEMVFLLAWAYEKLQRGTFSKQEDNLMLDEIKLVLVGAI